MGVSSLNMQKHSGNIKGIPTKDKGWCAQKNRFVEQTYYKNTINNSGFGRTCDECDDSCTYECDYKRAQG